MEDHDVAERAGLAPLAQQGARFSAPPTITESPIARTSLRATREQSPSGCGAEAALATSAGPPIGVAPGAAPGGGAVPSSAVAGSPTGDPGSGVAAAGVAAATDSSTVPMAREAGGAGAVAPTVATTSSASAAAVAPASALPR